MRLAELYEVDFPFLAGEPLLLPIPGRIPHRLHVACRVIVRRSWEVRVWNRLVAAFLVERESRLRALNLLWTEIQASYVRLGRARALPVASITEMLDQVKLEFVLLVAEHGSSFFGRLHAPVGSGSMVQEALLLSQPLLVGAWLVSWVERDDVIVWGRRSALGFLLVITKVLLHWSLQRDESING